MADPLRSDADPAIILHIGYHKTGSSWLQSSLFPALKDVDLIRDSEAVISELVAVASFDFDSVRARQRILAERGHAPTLLVSMERLSGHPDSGGFDSETIAGRLFETFPEARVLVVIRRQSDMVMAIYGEYVRTGGVESLRRYVRPMRGSHRVPRFDLRHLEYDRLIAHYRSLFGSDRVKVLAYEQLPADIEGFASAVTDFCQVPPPTSLDVGLVHPSMAPITIGLKRRLNLVTTRDAVNPAGFIDHEGLANRVARGINRADRGIPRLVRQLGRARMTKAADLATSDRYSASNRRTMELTGLPLADLGYDV